MKDITSQVILHESPLSEEIIPSVQGESYIYKTRLSQKRPIYAPMKCKSQKDRPLEFLRELGKEASLLFMFEGKNIAVMSILNALKSGALKAGHGGEASVKTKIATVNISKGEFLKMCMEENIGGMITTCELACKTSQDRIPLKSEMVIAFSTEDGRRGLFLVETIDQEHEFVSLKAFHILK